MRERPGMTRDLLSLIRDGAPKSSVEWLLIAAILVLALTPWSMK